jgi:hypothetical protein
MREMVAQVGTRLDFDRPDRATVFPGEPRAEIDALEAPAPPLNLEDRYKDFLAVVDWDCAIRAAQENRMRQQILAALQPESEEPEDQDDGPA